MGDGDYGNGAAEDERCFSAFGLQYLPAGGSDTLYHEPYDPIQFDNVGFGGKYGYAGAIWNLYYLQHRYYNVGTNSFLNRDPIGTKGGINLYAYCGNNPLTREDPEGTSSNGQTDEEDEILGNASSDRDTVAPLTGQINKLSVVGQQAGLLAASFNAPNIAAEGLSGQDAAGHKVSNLNRGLDLGTFIVGPAMSLIGKIGDFAASRAIANATRNGLQYQVRSSGAVHVLTSPTTLEVTENHANHLIDIFKRNQNGNINFFDSAFWTHVLPHVHTYTLTNPPAALNANWRNTFRLGTMVKRLWPF